MIEAINSILIFLYQYPFVLFAGMGYLNGSLFRNIGFLKIVGLIFVVPFSLQLLSELNLIFIATIPFLTFAVIGYWRIEKTKYYILIAQDVVLDIKERFK